MNFDTGALVKARGREWVVLPESNFQNEILVLRPLGGSDEEITGIYVGPGRDGQPLELVESAEFPLPDPSRDLGNQLSCALLRDAVRLGFRSGAGPFRSLARIGVEPRPYQLVPLLMALKLDPIRLLIADDVGIGKTVEACLIAREMIDRGEVSGFTVLCPPHLAEQWQTALNDQFHLSTELVLSSTAARLERNCRQDESLFERYPYTIVSTDYIKSERRRHEFLRSCPKLVLVDEAHGCAANSGRSLSQRRHELLKALVNPDEKKSSQRHLILVTATPHSGNDEAFRSLLSLLNPQFSELPTNLSGNENRGHREKLAKVFVQRRRGDLKAYLDTVTPFPERGTAEAHYEMQASYRNYLDRVLAYCREMIRDDSGVAHRQRVRWWSALALLRSISSSPAAAAATLKNRSASSLGETVEQVDAEGRRAILDLDDESFEGHDVIPGSDCDDFNEREKRKLKDLAREAEKLVNKPSQDEKLKLALTNVEKLLNDGFAPILFCRFIPTVNYVADFLRHKLEKKGITVEAITGTLPPEERKRRVNALGDKNQRVLVCTDCLSEGINLQHLFDSVIHYDLSWNPTRHEQREGRVDRYGQKKEKVRCLTIFGKNNPVDGIILEVLLRKHGKIRKQLGITVPIPADAAFVEKAILEGLLLRKNDDPDQLCFDFANEVYRDVNIQWNASVEREKQSRTLFAQNQMLKAINDEVRLELEEVRKAVGSQTDVKNFCRIAFQSLGAGVSESDPMQLSLTEIPKSLKDRPWWQETLKVCFETSPRQKEIHLTRTHPLVEDLASHVLETALDTELNGLGKRCGVIRTTAVERRTTVLLLRFRFHILSQGRDGEPYPLLAEDLVLAGFRGSPDHAEWLEQDAVETLLIADAVANMGTGQAEHGIRNILDRFDVIKPHLNQLADERGKILFDAHRRVRKTTGSGVRNLKLEVHKPADVLGVFVYLPATPGGAA